MSTETQETLPTPNVFLPEKLASKAVSFNIIPEVKSITEETTLLHFAGRMIFLTHKKYCPHKLRSPRGGGGEKHRIDFEIVYA